MKKSIQTTAIVLILITCFAALAWAEGATKEEVVAKCEAAGKLVKEKGLEMASQAIGDKEGPFVWKDTYVFCLDLNKTCNIAHPIKPKLIGKNLMAAKDANGELFFAEFINVAKNKGEGWVSYMWPKPGEKKPSPKVAYVYKVPGEDVAMLAGIYE